MIQLRSRCLCLGLSSWAPWQLSFAPQQCIANQWSQCSRWTVLTTVLLTCRLVLLLMPHLPRLELIAHLPLPLPKPHSLPEGNGGQNKRLNAS